MDKKVVRRITIDEKLATGLMRILVSELKPGVTEFDNDLRYWGKEEDLLVQPDDFPKVMGITLKSSRKWPWNSLYEGQTFLQGYFAMKASPQDGPQFMAHTTRKNFMCINTLIKKSIKQMYFSAIKGSVSHGRRDKT